MSMIGQKGLIAHLTKLSSVWKFPKLLIITGPEGQGKKTLVKHIVSDIMNCSSYVPEDLKVESIRTLIDNGNTLTENRIYCLLDCDKMNAASQNALLKFTEEPPQFAYIIITVQSESSLLPTIKSRGMMLSMEQYTVPELKELTDDLAVLDCCTNPGQVLQMLNEGNGTIEVCEKVVANIGKISAANAFQIMKHISVEELHLVIPTLLSSYTKLIKNGVDCSNELRVVYKYKAQVEHISINTPNALEMMFLDLRDAAVKRGQ